MAGTLHTLNPKPLISHRILFKTPPPSSSSSNLIKSSPNFFISCPNSHSLRLYRSISSHTVVKSNLSSNQVTDNGDQHDKISLKKTVSWEKSLFDFAGTNFLPLALVSGVVLGLVNPTLGCLAHQYSVSKFSTFGIFLISGLLLRSEEIGAATEAWTAGLFGLVSILLLAPFFSKVILQLQLVPQEFVTGLAVFSCMPTTLSSGVALTQLAGGNTALALAITVISNLIGILTVPLSISKFIAEGVGVSVPTKQLFKSLVVTLVVPLVWGKVSRDCFKGVSEFVDQNRKKLSMLSAILLSLVPWMQVSRSRSLLLMVKPTMFLVAIGIGMVSHLILLAFNTVAVQSLSVATGGKDSVFSEKGNARALIIVASQKTLPVMVAVVEQLHGALGESALLVLPCVAAHINQIIIDSFLVNYWLQKDRVSSSVKEA
ncbi:probable sodium/metabolite cotransporter BASS4, chloroplastic [Papaver somniferum]|uniref:probable sodium/metabolite cotransporter BASS4, chloroplastic n=1 Tax=Papaver somniferum TaxID=3469 RepID=UPI000E6F773F|nr:probable sodium/metabolite cotransporter BASS4, chloroplastic [Papaver somniferum]XP_026417696.1 probable sodium/metabolite cotransporter BASS4, chloroplastic [Papaver somniferum]